MTNQPRAILYARVSTDDQADRGYSLPSQVDLCRQYANRLGYSVVAELVEDSSGTVPIHERAEGQKLIAMLQSREADALIVYQVDRLSRDIVNLLASVQKWIRAGIEVHTCDIGKIESELDIVLVIKGWQGSDERKKILERTMRGKRAKAESGKVVVCGHAPYGYAYRRDERGRVDSFEFVEDEARVVRLIYQWYVDRDDSPHRRSVSQIAERLSEMRAPTPGERRNGYHRKLSSGIWNSHAVLSILENEVYAGAWRFNWRVGRTKIKRPLEEAITVDVPAIVSRDTWVRAQVQRQRNRELSARNCKHDYLLRGLISCGCGRSMIGTFPNHQRRYACSWHFSRHAGVEKRTCFEKYAQADLIEEDIWQDIREMFSALDGPRNSLKSAAFESLWTYDYHVKRQILEGLGVHVIVKEGRYLLKCLLGSKDGSVRRLPRRRKLAGDPNGIRAELTRRPIPANPSRPAVF